MKSTTSTVPGRHTRPRSLRARSTSMTCSLRSLGSARSSAASAGVLLRRRPARPGAGRRVHDGPLPRHRHQRLGRAADDVVRRLGAGEAQQVHVRRRVGRAQHPVEVERVDVGASSRSAATARPGTRRRRGCARAPARRRPGSPRAWSRCAPPGTAPRSSAATLGAAGAARSAAIASSRRTASSHAGSVTPRTTLAMSSTLPSAWSSTARSVASIIASSGMCRSSTAVLGSRSSRRTTSYDR